MCGIGVAKVPKPASHRYRSRAGQCGIGTEAKVRHRYRTFTLTCCFPRGPGRTLFELAVRSGDSPTFPFGAANGEQKQPRRTMGARRLQIAGDHTAL